MPLQVGDPVSVSNGFIVRAEPNSEVFGFVGSIEGDSVFVYSDRGWLGNYRTQVSRQEEFTIPGSGGVIELPLETIEPPLPSRSGQVGWQVGWVAFEELGTSIINNSAISQINFEVETELEVMPPLIPVAKSVPDLKVRSKRFKNLEID